MTSDVPFRALIAGGGPAALEAVLTLRELAPEIAVTVLSPESHHVYRPLSVVEPFARAKVRRYPLERLGELGVDVVRDALLRVDPDEHVVITDHGERYTYDALLVATGAQHRRVIPRVLTFEGPDYVEAMHGLVQDVEGGYVHSVVFVAPAGAMWTLPLYELALQTAERADAMCIDVHLTIVSHEARPLDVLGAEAAERVEQLLRDAGIAYVSGDVIPAADRIVALSVPACGPTPGLPADDEGFIPVDEYGRVVGVPQVWAAGDGTTHAIKQGGLATQQAEVAARSIASGAGAGAEIHPYDPVLRAMLVTGRGAWYFERALATDAPCRVSETPLWSPPSKIAGKRLAPYLDSLDEEIGALTFERRLQASS